jgi:hypothetical protein
VTTSQWLGVAGGIADAIGACLAILAIKLASRALAGEATMADLIKLRTLLREAGGLRFGYVAAGLFLVGAGFQIAASVVA